MKRILLGLAVMALSLNSLSAQTIQQGGVWYSLSSTTATVLEDQNKIEGVNYSTLDTIVLPDTIYYDNKWYAVKTINSYAFQNAKSLRSVTLPQTLTAINSYAFSGCDGLTKMDLPESLTTIGSYAFRNCVRIESITIPTNVTVVGSEAFTGCTSLKSVVWNAKKCDSYYSAYNVRAFYGCTNVESFTFGYDVEVIPYFLCYEMTKLTSITLPNSVTSIGRCAFNGCTGLQSLTLPEHITTIPYSMCGGCTALPSIIIPESVTTIDSYAFSSCTALTGVQLHEGLTAIGSYAFRNCKKIDAIVIPKTITTVGNNAFEDCTGLRSIVWNAKKCASAPTAYNVRPFYGCTNVETFTFGDEVEIVPPYLCYEMTEVVSLALPNTVTSIGKCAFYGCKGLQTLTLPNKITSIPSSMCSGCSQLSTIAIPQTVTDIQSYAFTNCKMLNAIEFPQGLTAIGSYSFRGCSELTELLIPEKVTSVGVNAFENCTGLLSVTWNAKKCTSSYTSYTDRPFWGCGNIASFVFGEEVETIPTYVCYDLQKVQEIRIPATVTSIGNYAFGNCTNLMTLYNYAENPQTIQSGVFSNVNKETCTLYVPTPSLGLYSGANVWKEFLHREGFNPEIKPVEEPTNLYYVGNSNDTIFTEQVQLHVPAAPEIDGFTFVKWTVVAGDLEDGIVLQAVYSANTGTEVQEIVVNPANPAQKLIRDGNVYILRDDELFTITGNKVK